MPAQQAFKGEITVAFDYRETPYSAPKREEIESERITYLMIESMFENVNILPVLYLSLNLSSDMYSKVVNTHESSTFYLKVRKKNGLSKTSMYEEVVNGNFSYVTSSTSANYSENLDTPKDKNTSYKGIMIGLVSSEMTNTLRKNFNGYYNNMSTDDLVNLALKDVPNMVKEPLKYSGFYKNFMVPPMQTRYKLLSYIFEKEPFYDSMFTFFMDFKKSYFVSKNGNPIDAGDGKPTTVIINVKDYTTKEAFNDGFTMQDGAYVVYINASDTNVVVNNATDKVSNNLVSFSDDNETQNLNLNMNGAMSSGQKTTYVRSKNAAAIKNELQANSTMIELMKQNIDGSMFTPNRVFKVNHYQDYAKYNGNYFVSYKREFYHYSDHNEFTVTCNVGLKMCGNEEIAKSVQDTYNPKDSIMSPGAIRSSSSSKKGYLNSTGASRNPS